MYSQNFLQQYTESLEARVLGVQPPDADIAETQKKLNYSLLKWFRNVILELLSVIYIRTCWINFSV